MHRLGTGQDVGAGEVDEVAGLSFSGHVLGAAYVGGAVGSLRTWGAGVTRWRVRLTQRSGRLGGDQTRQTAELGRPFVPVFPVVAQEFLAVVERVDAGQAVIVGVPPACGGMRCGDPFGGAVGAFSGDPAALGQWVVLAASEGQLVDVGGAAFRPLVDVVDFAFVARHVSAGSGTAAVFGMTI